MVSLDESDEFFPAVGETDGHLTGGPERPSKDGDAEGMFVPYDSRLPAVIKDRDEEGDSDRTANDFFRTYTVRSEYPRCFACDAKHRVAEH
jgi:hypothetical protein